MALTSAQRNTLVALWAATAVAIAGRTVALRWHATHDEFETGSDQFQAHWLAWLGTAALMTVAAVALRRRVSPPVGLQLIVGGGVGYAMVATWHFWLHSQHRDPDLPHMLLAVSQLVLAAGLVAFTVRAWRTT